VNHRYADISVKMPRSLMALENSLRKRLAQALKRGKMDVYVNYELTGDSLATPQLNYELAAAYQKILNEMRQELSLTGETTAEYIANQKDVIQVKEAELDEKALQKCLFAALEKGLEQLLAMRRVEGEETRLDLEARLQTAEALLVKVVERAPQVPLEWQEKLTERLARLQQGIEMDPQRVAQEIAVFTDRCDVSEEIARFKSHLVQFRALYEDSEPVGRRMDFLVQELNREVNTMGSKSNDAELTNSVVGMKSELEKIREQVQNIE
jgi:uncharacterized protein (TIGR00255 family)